MNRYIVFVATERVTREEFFDTTVESILRNVVKTNKKSLTEIETVSAICLTPDIDVQTDVESIEWSRLETEADIHHLICGLASPSEHDTNVEILANILHNLIDSLPRLGCLIDVFWFTSTDSNFQCPVSMYGALKRLQQWFDASITVVPTNVGAADLSSEFTVWADSLRANINPAVINGQQLAVWQGSIIVTGSEQSVKLSGYQLLGVSDASCFALKNAETKHKKNRLILSPTMNFIAEVDYSDVAPFFLTGNCFQLNVSSDCKSISNSRQFLDRLTQSTNLCYVLRLRYGSSWKEVECEGAEEGIARKKKKMGSWKELLKENIGNVYDNPCNVELQGNIGSFHFLVRAIADGERRFQFVAERLRSATDIDGSIAQSLCETVKVPRLTDSETRLPPPTDGLLKHVPFLSGDVMQLVLTSLACCQQKLAAVKRESSDTVGWFQQLAECRELCLKEFISRGLVSKDDSSLDVDNAVLQQLLPEYMQDPYLQPERQMLMMRTCDSTDGTLSTANDTLGKLSPPTKRRAIVLDATEFVKFFNADGTAANECSGKIVMKKPSLRLFNFDSDDNGQLRFAKWPECLKAHYHDVYYNVGNAEDVERRCIRLRSQLESGETASTCRVTETNLSPASRPTLLLSVADTRRKGRQPRRVTYADSDNSVSLDGAVTKQKLIPECLSSSQERRITEKRRSAASKPLEPANVDTKQQQQQQQQREPRSVRNRRKMEDVVRETLRVHDVTDVNPLFDACFKRLCTVTETFVKDLPTSRGLREEMQKIAEQYVAHTLEFEKRRASLT